MTVPRTRAESLRRALQDAETPLIVVTPRLNFMTLALNALQDAFDLLPPGSVVLLPGEVEKLRVQLANRRADAVAHRLGPVVAARGSSEGEGGSMTPEREAWLREWMKHEDSLIYPADARGLFAALDAERVARAAAEKERDTYREALQTISDNRIPPKQTRCQDEIMDGKPCQVFHVEAGSATSFARAALAAAASKEPAA